nr:hypothetical protein BaRGS_003083 [Batillaria attramentaria]
MYNPQFSQSTHAIDSGYSDVTLASTDPDDIADDGAPGKTRFNLDGEYNVLDVHGVDRELLKPQELDNDDYSHINSQPVDATYSSVQKGQGAAPEQRPAVEFDVSQLYSHVQKKGKGAAAVQRPQVGSDVSALYSQVQKKGKTTTPGVEGATGDSDVSALYSQVQKKGKTTTPFGVEGATGDSDGSALYSQVQKQGKKPVVAQKPKVALKPGVTDNYNRIDFPGDKPDLNGVDYTEDDAADTYNKLEHDVRRK